MAIHSCDSFGRKISIGKINKKLEITRFLLTPENEEKYYKTRIAEKISNEDIIKERDKKSESSLCENSSFRTWQQPEIVSDEYGNTKIEIVTKAGFENEGS